MDAGLWRARLVGFLREFGAEDAAEEALLDLGERVVVSRNHVLVVAREGDLLRLEVGAVGAAAPSASVFIFRYQ